MQRHQKFSKFEKNGMNGIIFFFCQILCLFVNLVPSASFCYNKRVSKKGQAIRGTSKIPISQLFSELGKTQKYIPGLFSKKKISILIINWEKLRSPATATFKNPKISLWIRNNLEVQPKVKAEKSQFCIYGRIGENYILI